MNTDKTRLKGLKTLIEKQEQFVSQQNKKLIALQQEYLLKNGWVIDKTCDKSLYDFIYSKGDSVFVRIDHAIDHEDDR